MKFSICLALTLTALSQGHAFSQGSTLPTNDPAAGNSTASVAAQYGKLPLSFEANQGQTDPQVRFLSRGQGYSLFLTDKAAVLSLTQAKQRSKAFEATPAKNAVVRMELAGAANGLQVDGADPLAGRKNYFLGSDPAKWHTNVPTFSKVQYTGVYPGVDLLYYGNQRQLEFDFIVAPNASPKPVKLHFDGAESLKLASNGDLKVTAGDGQITFHQPVVYQKKDGRRQPVEGKFALVAKNTVGFQLGSYDPSRELVIDPVLVYSTYLGGVGQYLGEPGDGFNYGDSVTNMAVDSAGNAYVSGVASSEDFPLTSRPLQSNNNVGTELFVSKLNPAGSALLYSTYLGGNPPVTVAIDPYFQSRLSLTVDNVGNVYLTGHAVGPTFPTTSGAFQRTNSAQGKAFALKLDTAGSNLVYSTLLGGSSGEYGGGIAIDPSGNAYVAGYTQSADFPTTAGAFQPKAKNSNYTGFVSKLNPSGSGLVYSTFLGGSGGENAATIFLDSSNNAFVGGYTFSSDFPTTSGAYNRTFQPPGPNSGVGFVSKLNSSGSGLVYSTYFPAPLFAVDPSGNAYALDTFRTADPVTKGALLSSGSGWVGKLNASGRALVYGTYVIPADGGYLYSLAVDAQGDVFLAGNSTGGFPVTSDAYQPNYKNVSGPDDSGTYPSNAVLAELNPTGSALLYGTYLGGGGSFQSSDGLSFAEGDSANAVVCDPLGNVYLAGSASSGDFPVSAGAFQRTNPGFEAEEDYTSSSNGFITKFAFHGATTTALSSSDTSVKLGSTVTFSASVRPVSGGTVPHGVLQFLVDGIPAAAVNLDGAGNADYTNSTLSAGAHLVNASYLGSASSSSSSAVLTEEITGGTVAAPIFYPLAGTYTPEGLAADLAIYNGVRITSSTPGATIYFTNDGSTPTISFLDLYSLPYLVSVGGLPTSTLRAIAVQSGNTTSSVSTAVYTINPKAISTFTTLTSSENPSTLGEAVTFTATVKADSGLVPTGNVLFRNGDDVIGAVPLVNGVATFTYSGLPLLGHYITAYYPGNGTDAEKGSPVLFQIVNPQ